MADFNIKDALTRKIGPLPTVVWVAIPAGGFVAYSYFKRATGDEPTSDFTSPEDEFDTGYPTLPDFTDPDPPSSERPPVTPDPYDNADWERDAIGWSIAQGLNPLDATVAIRAYLYGRPSAINQGQMNILRQIITAKGAAPNGGNIPPLVKNPEPTPTPKPGTPSKTPPRPPSGVGLRKISGTPGGRIQATWNASATANVKYEVERKKDKGPWRLVKSTPLNHAEMEANPGSHVVRVRARNAHGYSAYATSAPLVLTKTTAPKPKRRTG